MNDKAGAQVVKSWLDDADTEIEMVELGMTRGNRLSVSHLYYAVEKVTKAVRLANGIHRRQPMNIEIILRHARSACR